MNVSVRVSGPVGAALCQAFDDMDVRVETVLTGDLADDAALHGFLTRMRDFGLHVVDLRVSDGGTGESGRS